MKRAFFVLTLIALAAVWTGKKLASTRLSHELVKLQQLQQERESLIRERDFLRRRLNDSAKTIRISAESDATERETNRATPLETRLSPLMRVGDWTPTQNWRPRGQATPRATVESALWAAAGGDVNALRQLLSISDADRAAAAKLLNSIPPAFGFASQDPDELIAALTIKRIPIGEAQLVWLNQTEPDNATACVFLKDPLRDAHSTGAPAQSEIPEGIPPPQLPENNQTATAYLSLHREGERWRLVVPPSAIEKMARDTGLIVRSGS